MTSTSLLSLLAEAGLDTANTLTSQLREQAISKGWPAEVANGISITFDGANFDVVIQPNVQEQANALEYGTEALRPNPVIRNFKLRSQQASGLLAKNFTKESGWHA